MRFEMKTTVLCVAVLGSQLSTAGERWAVIEGAPADGNMLYMVSGDVRPEGADAWFDPVENSLLRSDCTTVKDYLTSVYAIPYRPVNPDLMFKTPPVGWMTWYSVKFDASDEVVMRNARGFMEKFRGYTDEKPVLWVDWEWYHGRFHEDGLNVETDMLSPRKDVYPRGLKPVADDLRAMGFTPALWVSVFCDVRTNALWKANPEWILGEDLVWCGGIWGNPSAPGYCEKFVPELFSLYKSWGYEAFKWDTYPVAYLWFDKFRKKGRPVGPSKEVLRKCTAAVREAVGKNTYLMSCSGELDEVNLTAADIFDAARIGGDIFDWKEFRKWGIDRILSYQPFHNTVLWSDADNLVLRPEFSTDAQARTRVSIYALAGVPITIGDDISVLDDKRIDMLRKTMPVVPLRPASLKRSGPAPDLLPIRADFGRPFGTWQVRGWCNLLTNKTQTASFEVSGSAVWDFWNDRLVHAGKGTKKLSVDIAPGDTALYRVTPLAVKGPTLLSVSRHITQGGYEIKEYSVDGTGARGVVRCPGGETVKVSFLLPDGFSLSAASHPVETVGRVVRLKLTSSAREDVAFSLSVTPTVRESAGKVIVAPTSFDAQVKSLRYAGDAMNGRVYADLKFNGGDAWGSVVLPPGRTGEFVFAGKRKPLRSGMNEFLPPGHSGTTAALPLSYQGMSWWWDSRPDWWGKRHEEKLEEIASSGGEIDLVMIGDSITHNWEGTGVPESDIGGAPLAGLRKKYSVLCLGYAADTTRNVLWRMQNGELDGYKAKCVMMMIGTNNGHKDSPADVASGVKAILDVIRGKQPSARVLLMAVFPTGEKPDSPRRVRVGKINAELRGLADGERVIWCDNNDRLLASDGTIPREIMPDLLHPHVKGYEIWADAVAPYLEKIIGR